jgi:hypothetical protein
MKPERFAPCITFCYNSFVVRGVEGLPPAHFNRGLVVGRVAYPRNLFGGRASRNHYA